MEYSRIVSIFYRFLHNLSILPQSAINKFFIFVLMLCVGSSTMYSQISQVGTTNAYLSNGTSFTIAKPQNVSVGDIMFLNIAKYRSSNSGEATVAGWTKIDERILGGANQIRGGVYYRIVDGTEGSTFTITFSNNANYAQAAIVAFTGVDSNNPFDATPSVNTTYDSSSPYNITIPGITTVTDNALVVMFGMACSSSTVPRTFSSLTGTNPSLSAAYVASQSGNYVSVGCATGLKATLGATGTGTIALTGGNVYIGGVLLALKPATSVANNSWIGYIYSGSNRDFSTDTYRGYYTEGETFYQNFGGGYVNYTIASNGATVYTENFSVRYCMNSTKKGLYTVNMSSDDGIKLSVDNTEIFRFWEDRGVATNQNVLMNLTGSSSLVYDFYENGGDNIVAFQNLIKLIGNELTANTTQTVFIGSSGSAISGDVFASLPPNVSLNGSTGYQWYYSTTPTGTQTAISGATGATFTPNTTTAPFNTAGTYYLFRYASLTSTNNVGHNPYTATNVSNYATVAVANREIIVSPASLSGFTYQDDLGPSATQTFVANGVGLTANVILTASAEYEISTNATSGFANTLTLVPTSGTLANTTVYVRLKQGLSVATYNARTVTLSSTGVSNKTVTLSGSVTANTMLTSDFWLKADVGTSTTTNGAGVTAWTGQSTFTNNATVSGTSPVYASTLWNFNPGINFSAGYFVLNRGAMQDDMTMFAVYNSTQTTAYTSWWQKPAIIGNEANGTTADFGVGQSGGRLYIKATYGDDFTETTATYNDGNPRIVSATRKKTTATGNNMFLFVNGTQVIGAPSDNYSLNNYANIGIGRNPTDANSQFQGGISEVIGKSYLSDAAERENFESYLAIKYGITLSHNYTRAVTAGADAIIYTISGYANDIAGVGRNTILGLNQKVSSSVNVASGSARVVMATNNDFTSSNLSTSRTALNNGQYLIWGHNNGTVGTWSTISGTSYSKVNRVWRVQNTGSVGSLYFQIDLSGFPALPFSHCYAVLVGNNAAFSGTTSAYPLANTSGGLYAANPTFPDGTNYYTIIAMPNYWKGSVTSTDWGTPSNWTANVVPGTGEDVEFATVANYGSVAQNDLVLDANRTIGGLTNLTNKKLIIPTEKLLTINGTVASLNNDPSLIYIQSSPTAANGSLIFNTTNPVYASVEMYSKASWNLSAGVNQKYKWQYFGIPVKSVVADPTFYGAYLREMLESGTAINNHWLQLGNSSVAVAFKGYEICQAAPTTYLFSGQLENGDKTLGAPFAITSGALYPGQHLLANPYTAAIDVRKIEFGNDMEKTVYLYNTGTFNDWQTSADVYGDLPGQYIAIPQNVAGTGSIPSQVPSMSSMLVKANSSTANAYVKFDYSEVVVRNTDKQRAPSVNKSALSATNTSATLLLIAVEGKQTSDKMWLIADDACSEKFDNGYDGLKFEASASQSSIYSVTSDGNYQIKSTNNIDNTRIYFRAGTDTEYTLRLRNYNLAEKYSTLYLYDELENKLIDITSETTNYTFTADNTVTAAQRFRIIAKPEAKAGNVMNVAVYNEGNTIYIRNISGLKTKVTVFDVSGRAVLTKEIASDELVTTQGVLQTPYIIHTVNNQGSGYNKILLK